MQRHLHQQVCLTCAVGETGSRSGGGAGGREQSANVACGCWVAAVVGSRNGGTDGVQYRMEVCQFFVLV